MDSVNLEINESDVEKQFKIRNVNTEADLKDTIDLFIRYTDSLGIDLSYQGFSEEMASMPGKYSPSLGGGLFLARSVATDESLGCVAFRALPESHDQKHTRCCEMKRLYVAPAGRGCGLGRALSLAAMHEAARKGYSEMVLDTLQSMTAAATLYESLGFRRIDAYYETPIQGTIFFSKDLTSL